MNDNHVFCVEHDPIDCRVYIGTVISQRQQCVKTERRADYGLTAIRTRQNCIPRETLYIYYTAADFRRGTGPERRRHEG